jgi:hypothetical protein
MAANAPGAARHSAIAGALETTGAQLFTHLALNPSEERRRAAKPQWADDVRE